MKSAPETIYLQWQDYEGEDVTWCVDKINETDVEYVRKDLYDDMVAMVKILELEVCIQQSKTHREAIQKLLEGYN